VLLNLVEGVLGSVVSVTCDAISDEVWAVIGPMFPPVAVKGRPSVDRRNVVEAPAWRYRSGAPWRDLPQQFGNWNTVYKVRPAVSG
jgi:transposase